MPTPAVADEPTALLSALSSLAPFYGARAAPVLRKALVELVGDKGTVGHASDGIEVARAGSANCLTAQAGPPRPHRRDRQPAATKRRRSNGASKAAGTRLPDCAWEELRQAVRAKMTAEGIDFAQLGTALNRTANTVRIALLKRSPPGRALGEAFAGWLADAAPEVAPRTDGFRAEPAIGVAAPAA